MSTTPPPGPWRDAHLHLAEHGLELACINLADCATLDEALQRIAQRADETPSETGWLKATGARAEAWPQRRLPNAEELHHAGGGRKVLVVSFDHHMMSVSRRVLEMGGVTRSTPAEYRSSSAFGGSVGAIEKDPETGEATGVLIEAACDIVRTLRPEVTPDERTEAIRAAQDDLIRLKIVEVHDMFATADLVSALHRLDTSGALALNVVLYAPPAHLEGVIDAIAACAPSPRVRLGGLKLFTDGTLNSRTASMLAPYADPNPAHPAGTPFYTDAELLNFMRDMRQRDLDIAAHAIGDAAVRRLLDLWESFDDASQSTLRLEHAQFIDEGDIDRLCEPARRVVVSMQPCHLLTDMEAIERLTPQRADRAFALRDLLDACERFGVDPAQRIVLGSDTPVVRPDPMDNLQAAAERRRAGMGPQRAIAPGQAISAEECAALMRPSA
ncbi:MAG: amidohydrolase family protein [Phycisphaerales bacterium]|nr:amidohydrolase family protein [Phycisphaerales bacterium]